MRASVVAHTQLHKLTPLFDMLYKNKEGELWPYDEQGVLYRTYHSCMGVCQGCVLWTFLFCLAIAPIYAHR